MIFTKNHRPLVRKPNEAQISRKPGHQLELIKKLSPALCDFVGDVAELESENGRRVTASLVVNVNAAFFIEMPARKNIN